MSAFATGREAVEMLPPSIRIGPFDWTIDKWSAVKASAQRNWGECCVGELRLSLGTDTPSPLKACDTLLHEIGHAIYWSYKLSDDDKEERIVAVNATAWTQVFRDNRWLLGWIERAVTPDSDGIEDAFRRMKTIE